MYILIANEYISTANSCYTFLYDIKDAMTIARENSVMSRLRGTLSYLLDRVIAAETIKLQPDPRNVTTVMYGIIKHKWIENIIKLCVHKNIMT
jgi:hypothetical protein